jgi:hypothetical protein
LRYPLTFSVHGEYIAGSPSGPAVPVRLTRFGRVLQFTREAVLRDDVASFGQLQQALGVSAAQAENDLVYELLLANPTWRTGSRSCRPHMGNLMPAKALDATSLAAACAALATISRHGRPAFLVVGTSHGATARELITKQTPPDTGDASGVLQVGTTGSPRAGTSRPIRSNGRRSSPRTSAASRGRAVQSGQLGHRRALVQGTRRVWRGGREREQHGLHAPRMSDRPGALLDRLLAALARRALRRAGVRALLDLEVGPVRHDGGDLRARRWRRLALRGDGERGDRRAAVAAVDLLGTPARAGVLALDGAAAAQADPAFRRVT